MYPQTRKARCYEYQNSAKRAAFQTIVSQMPEEKREAAMIHLARLAKVQENRVNRAQTVAYTQT